ncbi:hypothetical protein HAX54_040337 [Datura stramonium]|uniref:AB hydrolase-1 domain-containing protein n=1 Tax=Datura stramonium TaxID=4076 RepID=A0ABS8VMK3_DATST|nr:hypothetical protein [Datura stramonium]
MILVEASDDSGGKLEKTTFKDFVDDLLDMLDSLVIHDQVYLVGKDFGARVVYHFVLLHPNRVSAVATLGVPFLLTGPQAFPRDLLPKGFYMLRWQEPGRAEADFDTKTVVKKWTWFILLLHSLPGSLKKILQTMASLYENSGFRTALQKDYALKFGGLEQYISSGMVKEYVPNL